MSLAEALKLAQSNQPSAALKVFDSIKGKYTKDSNFWTQFALVALQAELVDIAITCSNQALDINPNNPSANYSMAVAKSKAGDNREVEIYLKKAFALEPSFNYGIKLADLLVLHNKHDECLILLEQLKKIAKNDTEASKIVLIICNIMIAQGKSEEALEEYRALLHSRTKNLRVFSAYVAAKKITEEDLEIISYYENLPQEIIKTAPNIEELYISLGKAYGDLKDYKKSAEYYILGKNSTRKINWNRKPFSDRIQNTLQLLTKEFISEKQLPPSKEITPIFIVGMPRSGTTLLEQILYTNKNTFACGELDVILKLAHKAKIETTNTVINYPESLQSLPKEFFTQCVKIYEANLLRLEPNAKYYVDKLPQNINHVGFIKILFPHAKIIHIKRDLREIGLSIFIQIFKDTQMQYANDFDEILFHMEQYLIIQNHWKATIPEGFIEVKYSDLIENFDKTAHKVFNYCEMEWTGEAANFHQNQGVANTASKYQVKQPIYKSSLGKWKNYEKYFGDFFERIHQLSEKYEYLA